MSRSFVWLFALIVFLLSCQPRVSRVMHNSEQVWLTGQTVRTTSCGDYLSYLPDPAAPDRFATRLIRLNFHFMNTRAGNSNYSPGQAREFATQLVKEANASLEDNQKMWLPPGNKTPILSTNYRYVIAASNGFEEEKGIYCHYDDEHYFFVSRGRNKNNYDRSVIRTYGIGLDSILNVFVMPHHPDSVASSSYDVTSAGIALGPAIKLSGIFETGKKPWEFKGLLNHEIGHVLGLRHTWSGNDGCDDTPTNPNCWNKTGEPPCDTAASNNLMDYNANQHAWTPCQIGKIHQNFANENSLPRKLLVQTWCQYKQDKTVVVSESTVWQGAVDLSGDLIISGESTLRIQCRASIPPGGQIIVGAGSHLILENARLHNACGRDWLGIFTESEKGLEGRITMEGTCSIENTPW